MSKHSDIVEIERSGSLFPIGEFNQIFRSQSSGEFPRDVLGRGSIRALKLTQESFGTREPSDAAPAVAPGPAEVATLIAAAGHDTTSSTISGGRLALLNNPEQLSDAADNPDAIPRLVAETMRWVTPVRHFMRSSSAATEVRGVRVEPNRHLALGTGLHGCLGMHVAQLEMRILWEELLRRIASAELSGDPAHLASNWVGGLKSLPGSVRMK